ncbi:MAG: hypothetical protein CVU44_03205 [Chloroflexi bacterium HGW-Chloroflexi-6]|nr:MAG: hypothetical protein CVU44_03205 [Chloroflexi bacterium HGW-Chloroflexi-6]
MSHRVKICFLGCLIIAMLGCLVTLLSMPPTISLTIAPGATRIAPIDNMVQVYVPGGDFTMGSNVSGSDEKPAHTVYLDPYWIDQTEVTQGMYTKCQAAGKCGQPSDSNGGDNYPVIYVDWHDANAYCTWAGRRLPTEAEWEKAARGSDGRQYPWGNAEPDCDRTNGGLKTNSCVGRTVAVGSYPTGVSPYNALDMAGNVWEWVYDWYDNDYYHSSPHKNPTGPENGEYRVLRGGGWHVVADGLRSAFRTYYPPSSKYSTVGFRCLHPAP